MQSKDLPIFHLACNKQGSARASKQHPMLHKISYAKDRVNTHDRTARAHAVNDDVAHFTILGQR